MAKEFTKEELIAQLETKMQNGMVSMDDIAAIVFDERFPQHLSDNAQGELISARNDMARFKELSKILTPSWERLIQLQEELRNLSQSTEENVEEIFLRRVEMNGIQNEIRHLEAEFDSIADRIKKRTKQS